MYEHNVDKYKVMTTNIGIWCKTLFIMYLLWM